MRSTSSRYLTRLAALLLVVFAAVETTQTGAFLSFVIVESYVHIFILSTTPTADCSDRFVGHFSFGSQLTA